MVKRILVPISLCVLISLSAFGTETLFERPYQMEQCTESLVKSKYGTEYRIMVSVPQMEPPKEGFPVIYLLDGNELFPVVAGVLRLLAGTEKLSRHNGISPAIVVGIGYPGASSRDLDYTPPAIPADKPETYRNGEPYRERPAGGADRFLEFIESSLKPQIEKNHLIDRTRQCLMGNGYGGLFALHVMFTNPSSFQSYVAASPSVWWNNRYILNEEVIFSDNPSPVRLLLTVGEGEQSLSRAELAWPEDEREEHRHKIVQRNMVDSTRELFWRLRRLEAKGMEVEFAAFQGESHKSAASLSISRSLPFLVPLMQSEKENP